jgi:hypothetical protein
VLICLDTNCVIYLVENNPTWGPKIAADAMRGLLAIGPDRQGPGYGSVWGATKSVFNGADFATIVASTWAQLS